MSAGTDLILVPVCLWLAFLIRLGFENLISPAEYWWLFLSAVATSIPVFAMSGLYRSVLRYMGRDTIVSLFTATTISALLLALIIFWSKSDLLLPRTLIINYWFLLFAMIGGARFVARAFLLPQARVFLWSSLWRSTAPGDNRRQVAIYGAGAAGVQLYSSIRQEKDIRSVAFIDDHKNLRGRTIGGLKVHSQSEVSELIKRSGISEIFLAIPTLDAANRQKILEFLERFPVHVRTVPSLYEIASGKKDVEELQEVRVEDILGRQVVAPAPELLERCVTNKVVMVTGGGGSIGSELCRQLLALRPISLVIFEQSEFNLFTIDEELNEELKSRGLHTTVIPVLGSVLNREQLAATIRTHQVATIYHAAAYKHVPIVEANVTAGMRNNLIGTLYAAHAALTCGVENFVLISTDKAVHPSSVMGASKRLAEMTLQALALEKNPSFPGFTELPRIDDSETETRFTIVRFGNVLASSGSVIPKFRSQIEAGGPVTVTHPDVTRYFMTLVEAAQLVIQASSMGAGGDVFILNMGEPVKIHDLAIKMIRLSGKTPRISEEPDGEIDIVITGLRPGEKIHEELHASETAFPTGHPKIYRAQEKFLPWQQLAGVLDSMQNALKSQDLSELRNLLATSLEGFEVEALRSSGDNGDEETKVVTFIPGFQKHS